MGADDDTGCAGHVWQLAGVALATGGAQSEYRCVRCPAVLMVGPDDIPPGTV